MREMHHERDNMIERWQVKEIYLIARVFSLGDSGTGLLLYVNPEPPWPVGELEFKAENGNYVVLSVGT